jgi:glucokinase
MTKKFAIGVDLGGTNVKYGIISSEGEIVHRDLRPLGEEKTRRRVWEVIHSAVAELLDTAKSKGHRISHIGIGSPGTVNFLSGKVEGFSPNLPFLVGVNLKQGINRRFPEYKVFADNDANVMALAEHKLGAGRGLKDALCLTLGTGIGGGLILDGKVYRGSHGFGGEFGHMPINYQGRLCACGGRGCLEAYASVPALLREIRSLLRRRKDSLLKDWLGGDSKKLTSQLVMEAFKLGDEVATEAVDRLVEALAAGIVGVVNLLNPEAVIIGGGLADSGEVFIKRIKVAVGNRGMSSNTRGLKILKAKLGNRAGFIGAALLGWQPGRESQR